MTTEEETIYSEVDNTIVLLKVLVLIFVKSYTTKHYYLYIRIHTYRIQNNIILTTAMSTTVVFACKSNSCRSQMAEGWVSKMVAGSVKVVGYFAIFSFVVSVLLTT